MPLINCRCGKTLNIPDELAGKLVRCPGCKQEYRLKPPAQSQVAIRQSAEPQTQIPAPEWNSQSLRTPDAYRPASTRAVKSSSKFTLWLALGVTAAVVLAASCIAIVVIAVRLLPDVLTAHESISTQITTTDSPTSVLPESNAPYSLLTDSVPPLEETLRKFREAGLATTTAELEQQYRLAPGEKDSTELWLKAIRLAGNADLRTQGASLPIINRSLSGEPYLLPNSEELSLAKRLLTKHADALSLAQVAAKAGGKVR